MLLLKKILKKCGYFFFSSSNKTNIVVIWLRIKTKQSPIITLEIKKGPTNLHFGSLRELMLNSVFSQYLRDKVEKTQFFL